MRTTVGLDSVTALVEGRHEDPFSMLGPHVIDEGGRRMLGVRAFLPHAKQAWVLHPAHSTSQPMRRIHPSGLFEAICPAPETTKRASRICSRVADHRASKMTMHDPYAFPPLLTDYDLYLLGRRHGIGEATNKLGRPATAPSTASDGVNFAVWAPNAARRQRRRRLQRLGRPPASHAKTHPQRRLGAVHPWLSAKALQVPREVEMGRRDRQVRPVRLRRRIAAAHRQSKVADLERYHWHDEAWMRDRRAPPTAAISP